uniref:MIA SH3 domain ER export factor 3 n=1 Tax=Nothobranchius furzeri TaxID=105023 RepID=A0A8C6K3T9_NOTFU
FNMSVESEKLPKPPLMEPDHIYVFLLRELQHMISLLPEEWKPGETLFGVPWQAVVITAFVGVFTFILFFWRTILAVGVGIFMFLCQNHIDMLVFDLEKSKEKLQLSRKKIQEALTKTTVLLDEAKIREDARNAQQKSLQKDFTALKEENKTLKATIKSWEEKHKELNEKIKVYQKSQKELEDSVMLKDHNLEVLSDLLVDLDACGLQNGEAKVLANGEVASGEFCWMTEFYFNIRQIQTTLTVVEEERDRFMAKLLNEEKSRKELEEKHQELEHTIGSLKSEKSQVESQFKILQQKNEIMVEMYQQKENALQQRLTKEELERRSKENLLSEVGGKALEAEEQVKLLRQRINEMEEQMKKTEEVYKEQVNARNAERALSDSYGPSPVSGGAPSPPIMIEGPRRPPSAPVGRRSDPFGPRPPSDPHGCYPDNKHISGMGRCPFEVVSPYFPVVLILMVYFVFIFSLSDMMGPRSSSPANLDVTVSRSFIRNDHFIHSNPPPTHRPGALT